MIWQQNLRFLRLCVLFKAEFSLLSCSSSLDCQSFFCVILSDFFFYMFSSLTLSRLAVADRCSNIPFTTSEEYLVLKN